MRILLTGASGFIGSHLAEELVAQDWEVWCAVRPTSSRKWLTSKALHFVELDLGSEAQMERALAPLRPEVVVHAAGATKCRRREDFFAVNSEGTRRLCAVLARLSPGRPPRFVMLSSLSVVNSIPGQELGRPTAYGASKLRAEEAVRASGLPYVILRPTGVYGPREKDYFMMVKSIRHHIDIAAGFGPQILTFIYVSDLCRAVRHAILWPSALGRAIALSDGREYTSRQFSEYIRDHVRQVYNRRTWPVVRLTVPLFLLRLVCLAGEACNRLTGRVTTLNLDKYNILSQRRWTCDLGDAREYLHFEPEVLLHDGVSRIVSWYHTSNWLDKVPPHHVK